MKNSVALFVLSLLSCLAAVSQTEKFDIAEFIPPKNWEKASSNGVVTYTTVNKTTGTFCVLALYTSSTGSNNAPKDFTNEWNDRIITQYKAAPDPKTETQTNAGGWKIVSGAAPIKLEALDAVVVLTVYSGFGKKFSAITILNDQAYTTEVDLVLKNMSLNKNNNPMVTNTQEPNKISGTGGTTSQSGSITYTLPTGWKVTKYSDGDIVTPENLPAGEFLEIWVQPSEKFSGTMEAALQKFYDETAAKFPATKMNDVNGGNYAKVPAKISFRGWEYIRCSGGIHMGGGDYPKEYGLDLFVVKINDRFEKISIVNSRNNCNLSRYYPYERQSYNNDIENFLFSLQFDGWQESLNEDATTSGGAIAGVWQGISMVVGAPKPGAELGAQLKVKQLIFFKNGQAFFGTNFPAEGLFTLNTRVRAEKNRRDWGTYGFANGRGVLQLPYGNIPLRLDNDKLIITTTNTNHAFIKENPVDGAVFNGSYAMSSKTFTGEETGITPLIQFTPDGKFTDKGALKILCHEYNECLNPAVLPGSGTYFVKDYSIVFNYTDGRVVKIAFMGSNYEKGNQTPATLLLSFNEDLLTKQ